MTGNVSVPLYANPTDPQQRGQALAIMRAQLLAQQAQQNAQMPADNEMAGNVVVKHSPLEYLTHAISGVQANSQQMKAAKMQMALMGQSMAGAGGAGGGTAGAGGINPGTLRTAAMYDQMYGEGAGKAYLESLQPTPDMKNAAASSVANPLDYNRQSSQNTAQANASFKPNTVTMPDGRTYQTTDAQLAQQAGGGVPAAPVSQPPAFGMGGDPMSLPKAAQQAPPLNGANNELGGMGNPNVSPTGAPSSTSPPPAGASEGQAQQGIYPSLAAAQAAPLTPQEQAQAPDQPLLSTNPAQRNPVPPSPPGMQIQSPSQAAGQKSVAEETGKNVAEAQKAFNIMQSQLPNVLRRFNDIKKNIPDASSGFGSDANGEGWSQEMSKNLGTKTATANANLMTLTAQGIIPEISQMMGNSGMKPNKFLEGTIAGAGGLDMKNPPEAKMSQVKNLQDNYIYNLKASAGVLRKNNVPGIPSDADIDAMVDQYSQQKQMTSPSGIKYTVKQ